MPALRTAAKYLATKCLRLKEKEFDALNHSSITEKGFNEGIDDDANHDKSILQSHEIGIVLL